jgi:hypothetical protein
MIEVKYGTKIPQELRGLARYLHEFKFDYKPCIYFLCRERKVVYVGQTTDLLQRIIGHASKDKDFDKIFHYDVEITSDIDVLERVFIKIFQPALNKTHHPLSGKSSGEYVHIRKSDYELIKKIFPCEVFEAFFNDKIKVGTSRTLPKTYQPGRVKLSLKKQRNTTSKYRGVSWDKQIGRWKGSVYYALNRHIVGYFFSQIEAAKAVDTKYFELTGDCSKLNFPQDRDFLIEERREKPTKPQQMTWCYEI